MGKIKILIVDDHAIFRDAVRALLGTHYEIEIVGEASDGNESIQKALDVTPDVILMDLVMPGMDGLEATRRIREKDQKVKVLVLTQHEDREYVLSAFKAGVDGYVVKRAMASEIVTAIRTVYSGDTYLHPSAAKALIEGYVQLAEHKPFSQPTARQLEILRLVALGYTSRKIGEMLQIGLKTVQGHRLKITKKLDLHNHTELIKYAVLKGLLSKDT